jgi:hypothetical protein
MDHIITANDSKEIEIHSKRLDWTWTLGELFQQPENEVVTSAIEKLCTKISWKFDVEILLHKLETTAKEAKENTPNHWMFTTLRAMIGGAIICLFILFCWWRMCCSSGQAPVTYPAQPTIFNMTVDPIQR